MSSESSTVSKFHQQPFTIHSLNNYTNVGLASLVDHLDLQSEQVRTIIRTEHLKLVAELNGKNIDYLELRNALVPQTHRHEAAFIFDPACSESEMYGYTFAKKWIPILKQHGPEKTVLRVGDILTLPSTFVWRELDRLLVGPKNFPRNAREEYFVLYITNLSAGQLHRIDSALNAAVPAYLGHVDCSTWSPFKAGLYLPQVGLRLRDQIITEMDDDGTPNPAGYPYTKSGFRLVGVDQLRYGLYLGHRLDNGIPQWADDDSAMALTVLGGGRRPITSTEVVIDENRIDYLGRDHGASLSKARLSALDKEELAAAIRRKFTNGLIYNLRFKPGSRRGVTAPELDAMMFSVQVEFPDIGGAIRRYQVGLKYTADDHTSEIITFY
ncbi:hypothetical protein [Brevibacterium celere]|uniref:hypothetical protein n=1 Tax=Brevibacterium celere TaxID=225845 RepID=UPI0031D0445F